MSKVVGRLRILLDVEGQLKKFFWFECKGDDIYWGYSGTTRETQSFEIDGSSTTIDVSKAPIEEITSLKSSYHESGQFHIKITDDQGLPKYRDVMNWQRPNEIKEPLRIMAVITKIPSEYEDYIGSPTRNRTHAAIIRLGNQHNLKHYFEFFITPEGEFARPRLLLHTHEPVADFPLLTQSLSERYILVVRELHFSPDNPINSWQPHKQIVFHTMPKMG